MRIFILRIGAGLLIVSYLVLGILVLSGVVPWPVGLVLAFVFRTIYRNRLTAAAKEVRAEGVDRIKAEIANLEGTPEKNRREANLN